MTRPLCSLHSRIKLAVQLAIRSLECLTTSPTLSCFRCDDLGLIRSIRISTTTGIIITVIINIYRHDVACTHYNTSKYFTSMKTRIQWNKEIPKSRAFAKWWQFLASMLPKLPTTRPHHRTWLFWPCFGTAVCTAHHATVVNCSLLRSSICEQQKLSGVSFTFTNLSSNIIASILFAHLCCLQTSSPKSYRVFLNGPKSIRRPHTRSARGPQRLEEPFHDVQRHHQLWPPVSPRSLVAQNSQERRCRDCRRRRWRCGRSELLLPRPQGASSKCRTESRRTGNGRG
jgi:hypothetical protein